MKRLQTYCTIILITFASCNSNQQTTIESSEDKQVAFPERAASMNIYEVNIRQYTPEGTFNAFSDHLSRLKKMGVDILWIMPIHPIGKEKRKGGLGSPYSIQDYAAVNPDFGALEDFKNLVNKAHDLDMLVILDWVANHTSWDHKWISESPDFYTLDSLGNMQAPVADWSDVADLNYDNVKMQEAMISDMKFWIDNADIDGFRCDVAGFVPMTFWNKAKNALDEVKDVFMLAEWDDPKMHDTAFHMSYGWTFHHVLNEVAKGNQNADSVASFLTKDLEKFGPEAYRMNFTSNHDENSWNGTVKERMGDASQALAVLASTVQGMPLIYSGMEAGLDKRLSFFEKDSIDWSNLKLEKFYTQLLKLKHDNEAIWNGSFGGVPQRINEGANVFAFKRVKNGNTVIGIFNLSDENQKLIINDESVLGSYSDYFTNNKHTLSADGPLELTAWKYLIFTKK